MNDDLEESDPYDDDPYSNDEPLPELALQLLRAHREHPDRDNFHVLPGASLEDTDAAYAALRKEGLIDYADRIIDLPDGRRYTFLLTRNGL